MTRKLKGVHRDEMVDSVYSELDSNSRANGREAADGSCSFLKSEMKREWNGAAGTKSLVHY
mgnify:CR=1 FL=1